MALFILYLLPVSFPADDGLPNAAAQGFDRGHAWCESRVSGLEGGMGGVNGIGLVLHDGVRGPS